MRYTNDPTAVATALRRLADDLDTLGGTDLPEMAVDLSIQVTSHCRGSDTERRRTAAARRAAVDTLINTLTPGGHAELTGSNHYSLDYDERGRDCLNVAIYTGHAADDDVEGGEQA